MKMILRIKLIFKLKILRINLKTNGFHSKKFLKFQAKTTPHPLSLSIKKAKGSYITTTNGKKYLDLVAGVSACGLGTHTQNNFSH